MMAVRTDVASSRMPRTRLLPPCSATKRSSASCSRWQARWPIPFGTTCSTATWALKRLPRSRARRIASSACGPPRTGTRMEPTSSMPRCLTTAMSHGDSRTTESMVGEKTAGVRWATTPRSASARAAAAGDGGPPQPKMTRSVPSSPTASITPSDALPPDADHGSDLDSLLVAEVEDSLQQPARGARLGCALGQRDALRHLDDAQRGDLGGPAVADTGADADQVARGARVGQRQQDAVRHAPSGRHQPAAPPAARISFQRPTRYGFSSSNSRACASITRSAWSVVISSVSPMKPAVRAK